MLATHNGLRKSSPLLYVFNLKHSMNNHAMLAVVLHYAVGDMREKLVKLFSLLQRIRGVDIFCAVMEAFLSQDIRPEKVV